MNIGKRVLLSITRVFAKTIILFCVTSILALGIILSFLLRTGIDETKALMQKNLNLGVVLELIGDDKVNSESKKLFDKLAQSPYVEYYDYSNTLYNGTLNDSKGSIVKNIDENAKPQFIFKGIQNTNILPIRSKRAKLSDGRLFSDDELKKGSNVVVISSSLAKVNNYRVGDKIKTSVSLSEDAIQNSDNVVIGDNRINDDSKLLDTGEVEIIGIIDLDEDKIPINETFTRGDKQAIALQKANDLNTIYTTNNVIDNMASISVKDLPESSPLKQMGIISSGQPIFITKDADSLEAFVNESNSEVDKFTAGLGDSFVYSNIISDLKTVNSAKDSIKSISNLSSIVFYSLIILSVIVLALVITLFLRDRSHEFGIYLALGQNKVLSLMQVLMETLLIGMISFTIALALSSIFSSSISKAIINNSTTKIENKDMNNYQPTVSDFFPDAGNSIDENYIVNNYDISLDSKSIIIIYVIAFITLTSSTVVPMMYVLNLNPKKILM